MLLRIGADKRGGRLSTWTIFTRAPTPAPAQVVVVYRQSNQCWVFSAWTYASHKPINDGLSATARSCRVQHLLLRPEPTKEPPTSLQRDDEQPSPNLTRIWSQGKEALIQRFGHDGPFENFNLGQRGQYQRRVRSGFGAHHQLSQCYRFFIRQ